jgi:hypothetical protein
MHILEIAGMAKAVSNKGLPCGDLVPGAALPSNELGKRLGPQLQ